MQIGLASALSVSVLESQSEVEAGSTAQFTLEITNDGADRDVFSIESNELGVYPFSEFARKIEAKPYQVKLDSTESAIVKVYIQTIDVALPNKYYDSKMTISSVIHPETREEVSLKTYLASAKNLVQITPQMLSQITPGREIKVPLRLKNRAKTTMENVEIRMTTDIPNIAKTIQVTLKPQEEIQEEMALNFDSGVSPGTKKIVIAAYENNELRGSFVTEVEILPKERVEEDRETKTGFLSSRTIITRENKGNTASKQRVEVRYNLFQSMFSTMTPKPEREEGKIVWSFTLQPEEKQTMEIYVNYRPALYGLIVIIIFTAIFIFGIERSVVVKKRIFHSRQIAEGVKEHKIFILVRNGKKYALSDVKIMDLIPRSVELTSDFGSSIPDRVQKGERATRLLWNIMKLDAGEERVFSYKVHIKKNIIGNIVLPTAVIQYVDNKDKFVQVQSMRVVLE